MGEKTQAQQAVVDARDALVEVLRSRVGWKVGVCATDAELSVAWATYEARVIDANSGDPEKETLLRALTEANRITEQLRAELADSQSRICHGMGEDFPSEPDLLYTTDAVLAYVKADREHRPPLSSSPVARAEVTEEQVREAWDGAYRDHPPVRGRKVEWTELKAVDIEWHIAFARRIASLSSAPQDAAAGREKEREAFDRGWRVRHFEGDGHFGRAQDREYPTLPAPVAERVTPVKLTDGEFIVWREDHREFRRSVDERGATYRKWDADPTKLLYDTDTIADQKAVANLLRSQS